MYAVYVNEAQKEKVENYSKITGIPASSVIKLCINKFFENEE
jgi:hypothetical protein